jgi:hypothetical protein
MEDYTVLYCIVLYCIVLYCWLFLMFTSAVKSKMSHKINDCIALKISHKLGAEELSKRRAGDDTSLRSTDRNGWHCFEEVTSGNLAAVSVTVLHNVSPCFLCSTLIQRCRRSYRCRPALWILSRQWILRTCKQLRCLFQAKWQSRWHVVFGKTARCESLGYVLSDLKLSQGLLRVKQLWENWLASRACGTAPALSVGFWQGDWHSCLFYLHLHLLRCSVEELQTLLSTVVKDSEDGVVHFKAFAIWHSPVFLNTISNL